MKTSHPSTRKPGKNRKTLTLKQVLVVISVLLLVVALILSLILPVGKKQSVRKPAPVATESIPFRIDGHVKIFPANQSQPLHVNIEIADDELERTRGLMDRLSLPENAGMLFIFEEEDYRSFWMKNTFISLDIIYINSALEIVSIQKYTQPKTTQSLPSEKPAKYVLEVNAGYSDRYGIGPGDKIEFYAER